jgi:hypothetical protein
MRDWAVPVKAGSDPYADPFEKAALEKKERVVRNKLAQASTTDLRSICVCVLSLSGVGLSDCLARQVECPDRLSF